MGWTTQPLSVESEPFSGQDYKTQVVVPDRAGGFGTTVAECHHNWREASVGEHRISFKEAEANARLFSVAPRLYDLLETAVRVHDTCQQGGDPAALGLDTLDTWLAKARAVLADARGS